MTFGTILFVGVGAVIAVSAERCGVGELVGVTVAEFAGLAGVVVGKVFKTTKITTPTTTPNFGVAAGVVVLVICSVLAYFTGLGVCEPEFASRISMIDIIAFCTDENQK